MSVPVDKNYVVGRFNALVRDQLTPNLGNATNYYGNVPGASQSAIINHNQLGSRAEPGITTGEVSLAAADTGTTTANCIFNLLHNFAMTYTRVRQGKWVYVAGGVATEGTQALTALKPSLAVYFPLPEIPPKTGEPVVAQDIDNFLDLLRIKVNAIRTDYAYLHVFGAFACHSSCHSSCHGSRGRR